MDRKSGGLRTILAHDRADRVDFLYVSGENERGNIPAREHVALLELSDEYTRLAPEAMNRLVARGQRLEVCDDDETKRVYRHSRAGA